MYDTRLKGTQHIIFLINTDKAFDTLQIIYEFLFLQVLSMSLRIHFIKLLMKLYSMLKELSKLLYYALSFTHFIIQIYTIL